MAEGISIAALERQRIAEQLRPLAHASRLLVLCFVARNVVDVYHLSQRTQLSPALVRAHLRALYALGYIKPFWRRHQLCYRVVPEQLAWLEPLLLAFGSTALASCVFCKPSPAIA